MTQEELAKRVGVVEATVTAWEIGKQRPEGDNLAKLAENLAVPEAYILEGGKTANGADRPTTAALGGATDADLAELYRRLDHIEAEDIPAWLKVLRMDALSSAVRAEAMRMAERASSERAAAIRMAEEGAAERARAAGTEAEAALTRSLALQPTGGHEAEADVVKVAERVRRAGRAAGPPTGTPKRAAGE